MMMERAYHSARLEFVSSDRGEYPKYRRLARSMELEGVDRTIPETPSCRHWVQMAGHAR